jgi:hypothetical protein
MTFVHQARKLGNSVLAVVLLGVCALAQEEQQMKAVDVAAIKNERFENFLPLAPDLVRGKDGFSVEGGSSAVTVLGNSANASDISPTALPERRATRSCLMRGNLHHLHEADRDDAS